MYILSRPFWFVTGAILCLPAAAADFTIVDGQVVTTQQNLNANETGTIEQGGQLNTTGTVGVLGSGNDITVTNGGTINTTGIVADGIQTSGDNTVITNNGLISTAGGAGFARPIIANGNNLSITNNGTIITAGTGSVGIVSNGNGAPSGGDNSTVINNGTIISDLNGIFSGGVGSGNNNLIINNGSIVTKGPNFSLAFQADGISSNGDNTTIINTGSITTTETLSDGIESNGANATINNSGSINVSGAGATGINTTDSSTINNSGLISATGAATVAIQGGAAMDTLNLLSGSRIIGRIDLGGGLDTININTGANPSSTYTFFNTETVNFLGGIPGIVAGNIITTVDPTGQSVNAAVINSLTSSIHQVISQRMAHNVPLKPVQLAALEPTAGMLFQEREPVVWGEVFGSHRKRGADDLVLEHEHDYAGFVGGYERDFRKARIGVLAGYADSEVETDIDSVETDTTSVFAGGYGHFHLGMVNLTPALVGGVEDHDNDRLVFDNLNGLEKATADFDSVFISPSLTISAAYELADKLEFRPSATVAYTIAWYDDYRESGTTNSNLTVDERTVEAVHTRVQIAAAYALDENSELEVRTGMKGRFTDDDDIDANLAGTNFTFSASGDDSVYGGYIGGNLRIAVQDRIDLIGDMEYGYASGDESEVTARLSLEYRF